MCQSKCFSSVHLIAFSLEFFIITFSWIFSCLLKALVHGIELLCDNFIYNTFNSLGKAHKNCDAFVISSSTDCQTIFALETAESVVVHCFNRDTKWWYIYLCWTHTKKMRSCSHLKSWTKWHKIALEMACRWSANCIVISSEFFAIEHDPSASECSNLMFDFHFFFYFMFLLLAKQF